MRKLYVRVQYTQKSHTIIRVDDLPEFKKFVTDDEMVAHFQLMVLEVKLGNKPKIEPYIFNIEDNEFKGLEMAIKRKISSSYKHIIHFNQISLVEDSFHYPVIRILIKEPVEV